MSSLLNTVLGKQSVWGPMLWMGLALPLVGCEPLDQKGPGTTPNGTSPPATSPAEPGMPDQPGRGAGSGSPESSQPSPGSTPTLPESAP